METLVEVHLSPSDLKLLDEWRRDLSREAFLIFLLRMATSGRVNDGTKEPDTSQWTP